MVTVHYVVDLDNPIFSKINRQFIEIDRKIPLPLSEKSLPAWLHHHAYLHTILGFLYTQL